MGLLVDEAQVKLGLVYLEILLVLRRTYHRFRNSIGGTRWNSYMTWVMWNLVLICFETVLASVQDRCSVCIILTIGS
jgi:hypothetical protein